MNMRGSIECEDSQWKVMIDLIDDVVLFDAERSSRDPGFPLCLQDALCHCSIILSSSAGGRVSTPISFAS